jgi:hypothetical protein
MGTTKRKNTCNLQIREVDETVIIADICMALVKQFAEFSLTSRTDSNSTARKSAIVRQNKVGVITPSLPVTGTRNASRRNCESGTSPRL